METPTSHHLRKIEQVEARLQQLQAEGANADELEALALATLLQGRFGLTAVNSGISQARAALRQASNPDQKS